MTDWRALLYAAAEGKDMPEHWWSRVFGTNDIQLEPAALLEQLQRLGFELTGRFRGDDQGWFSVDIAFTAHLPPLQIERYLSTEDDIRAELNAWAAWLETLEKNPHAVRLMEHMVRTTQLFILRQPNPVLTSADVYAGRVNKAVCQFLARQTEGVYQIDQVGIFAADGTLLVRREEE